MKIALLFFGQPRFLYNPRSGIGYKTYIINKHDVDIFGHCWISHTFQASTWTSLGEMNGNMYPESKLCEDYPGIVIQKENSRSFGYDNLNENNIASHLYSIKKVASLLQERKDISQYDLIILSRYDVDIKHMEGLEKLGKGFFAMEDHPGVADQLYAFTPEYIKWCDIYDNFEELKRFGSNIEEMKLYHFQATFPGDNMRKEIDMNLKLIRSEF